MRRLILYILVIVIIFSMFSCKKEKSDGKDILPTWEEEELTVFEIGDYCINTAAEEAEDAVKYIKSVYKKQYGIDLETLTREDKCINITLDGDVLDWGVSLDEATGNITLTGGSSEALKRAAYWFSTAICAFDATKPTATERINYNYKNSTDKTDNSSLLSYISTDSVKLVSADSEGNLTVPEWVDSLVMVEIRPDTASIGGTLPECYDMLDFYASIGVNGIWIVPIYERGPGGNGYGNLGPHTLEPAITGTTDTEEGWNVVKEFVDYAHSKGIYVFLDVVTWGVMKGAPLTEEHPDWFSGEAWGNIAFNWSNAELVEWFTQTLVDNALKTGIDGYRCDCEPNYTGYELYENVRLRLADKGKYIAIMAEDGNERGSTYFCEQDGVLLYSAMTRGQLYQKPVNFYANGYMDIVDSVKNGTGLGSAASQSDASKCGTYKYYTCCITNHDYQKRDVLGNRINIGYSAILAPFIPIWYMGDEFNAYNDPGVLYDLYVNFEEAEQTENAFFLEDVRKMINIRRTYSDIFEYWPTNHRNSNICAVKTTGLGTLTAYARYGSNKAIIVVANNSKISYTGTVTVPFKECGIDGCGHYTITDLMTGCVILDGTEKELSSFTVSVPYQYIGVYAVDCYN